MEAEQQRENHSRMIALMKHLEECYEDRQQKIDGLMNQASQVDNELDNIQKIRAAHQISQEINEYCIRLTEEELERSKGNLAPKARAKVRYYVRVHKRCLELLTEEVERLDNRYETALTAIL